LYVASFRDVDVGFNVGELRIDGPSAAQRALSSSMKRREVDEIRVVSY
jgi:hypothetical protein